MDNKKREKFYAGFGKLTGLIVVDAGAWDVNSGSSIPRPNEDLIEQPGNLKGGFVRAGTGSLFEPESWAVDTALRRKQRPRSRPGEQLETIRTSKPEVKELFQW